MSNNTVPEQSGYEIVRQHWDEILGTVRHIITQFADESVEIASRLVMLLAPMPNAISLYNITQVQQGFSPFQALAFALTIEMASFFLIEVALLMLSGWLKGQHIYRYAFWAMCMVVLLGTGIVINLVYALEPHKVMAWLPVLSLCGFIAIGLKRWDSKNLQSGVKRTVKSGVKSTGGSFTTQPVKLDFTQRQQDLLQLLIPLSGKDVKDVNKSELARKMNVSRPTLLANLNALQEAGAISMNGHLAVNKGE